MNAKGLPTAESYDHGFVFHWAGQVICVIRIGADNKSRPASPTTLKSAGRGAYAIRALAW